MNSEQESDDPLTRLTVLGELLDPRVTSRVIENLPDALIIVDPEGNIRLVNGAAELLFGHPRQNLLGQEIEVVLPQYLRDVHKKHRSTYMAEPRTRPMGSGLQLVGLHRDGREIPIEVNLSPLVTVLGVYVMAVIRLRRGPPAKVQSHGSTSS